MSSLYTTGASVLQKLGNREGSVKRVTYAQGVQNKRQVYAIVTETLKYRKIIEELLRKVNFFHENRQLVKKKRLVLLMVHDLLFSKNKSIRGGGYLKKIILKYKSPLSSALVMMKIRKGAVDNEDLLPPSHRSSVSIPRYVRINTLKISVEEAINTLQSPKEDTQQMWIFKESNKKKEEEEEEDKLPCDHSTKGDDITTKESLNNKESITTTTTITTNRSFFIDDNLTDLLVFPPNTDLHDHSLVEEGKLILQGKASCVPAYVLSPGPTDNVIDACAAPGNKTTILSALMKNLGTIFAIDRDAERLNLLKRNIAKVGAKNITPVCSSFLDLDPTDKKFTKVSHILCDPSCSGSGIVGRLDHLVDDLFEESTRTQMELEARLKGLARFQLSVVLHAFKFPNVQRVVYSTCSIHEEENECVVKAALESQDIFHLVPAFTEWPTRGRKPTLTKSSLITEKEKKEEGNGNNNNNNNNNNKEESIPYEYCARMDPSSKTIGFFVACFDRISTECEYINNDSKRQELSSKKRERERKREVTDGNTKEIKNEINETECTFGNDGEELLLDTNNSIKDININKKGKKKKRRRRRKKKKGTKGLIII